uniref:Uncharacterized protein n=1 Tax=Anopheles atroparvus TaxID=41427 RepID=A0AAG5DEH1_ANOAO
MCVQKEDEPVRSSSSSTTEPASHRWHRLLRSRNFVDGENPGTREICVYPTAAGEGNRGKTCFHRKENKREE